MQLLGCAPDIRKPTSRKHNIISWIWSTTVPKVNMDSHERRPGTYFRGRMPSCHLFDQHILDAIHERPCSSSKLLDTSVQALLCLNLKHWSNIRLAVICLPLCIAQNTDELFEFSFSECLSKLTFRNLLLALHKLTTLKNSKRTSINVFEFKTTLY